MDYYLDELSTGMEASYVTTVTEAHIVMFAGVSGDTNPIHLDEEFAAATMFRGRIAHGMLSAGFISTVIGTKLPGNRSIYMNQSLAFKRPVRVGDTVRATVKITAIDTERNHVLLGTGCTVKGKQVISGEARIMVPSRPR